MPTRKCVLCAVGILLALGIAVGIGVALGLHFMPGAIYQTQIYITCSPINGSGCPSVCPSISLSETETPIAYQLSMANLQPIQVKSSGGQIYKSCNYASGVIR